MPTDSRPATATIPEDLAAAVIGDMRTVDSVRMRAAQRIAGMEGKKSALVIQGGALRAIISCAAADALDLLGLRSAFDVVYGASSGAVNAAYFLAGQSALGVTVYAEDVNNTKFFNPFRLTGALNLRYFIDEVVCGNKALDRRALASQSSKLLIALTDFESGDIFWFDDYKEGKGLLEAFEATCALPAAYRQPVMVAGRPFTDGMINEPVPVLSALKKDYAAVVVLLTREATYRSRARKSLPRRITVKTLMQRHLSPAVYRRLQDQWERYNEAMDLLGDPSRTSPMLTLAIGCDPELVPGRFAMNREKLLRAAYSGWLNTLRVFGYDGDMSRTAFEARLLAAKANKRNS